MRKAEIGDLEEAIKCVREAINATPPDCLERAMYLSNLGNNLCDIFISVGS